MLFRSSLTVGTGTVTAGNIVNSNANGIGNIGSSTVYYNTGFLKATTAQYADLAENYAADAGYTPGTVLVFGGNNEVTISSSNADVRVAGVVSTDPAHLMNSCLEAEFPIAVALTGRVPCRVIGTIAKGDRIVASHIPGVAMAMKHDEYQPGSIIGKALEDYNSDEEGVITVVIGKN